MLPPTYFIILLSRVHSHWRYHFYFENVFRLQKAAMERIWHDFCKQQKETACIAGMAISISHGLEYLFPSSERSTECSYANSYRLLSYLCTSGQQQAKRQY